MRPIFVKNCHNLNWSYIRRLLEKQNLKILESLYFISLGAEFVPMPHNKLQPWLGVLVVLMTSIDVCDSGPSKIKTFLSTRWLDGVVVLMMAFKTFWVERCRFKAHATTYKKKKNFDNLIYIFCKIYSI